MTQRRLFMIAALTCSLFVGTVPAAHAVELPEFVVESGGTITAKAGKLNLTGAGITCESATGTSSATSKQLGTYTMAFSGCKLKGEPCHSLADSGEAILVGTEGAGAEYHVVRLKVGEAGIWFLIPAVHIECNFEAVLVVVQGNVLGTIEKTEENTTNFTIGLKVVSGKQQLTEFENDAGEKVKAKLEGRIGGGAFKAATFELAEVHLTTAAETEICECKGPPNIVASPTAGGAELNFVGMVVGEKLEITLLNNGPRTAFLKEAWIEEGGKKPEENSFLLVAAAAKPCNLPTVNPFDKLVKNAWCNVGVELKRANQAATYVLKYSCWWGWLICGAERSVKMKS